MISKPLADDLDHRHVEDIVDSVVMCTDGTWLTGLHDIDQKVLWLRLSSFTPGAKLVIGCC